MTGAESFRVPADAYDRHVGRYGRRLASELVDFAGVERGMRALDVGCGPGALTTVLAESLGAESVSAADPSEPFADACRERAPGAQVVVAPAEALPFEDGAFDVTLSQLVVNFMDDPETGVREMARVTRPGGTVAACVWDYAGEMTLLRAFWDAAGEIVPEAAGEADEGIVMPWCREGDLAGLWRLSGLTGVRFGALAVSATYRSFDDLWGPPPPRRGAVGRVLPVARRGTAPGAPRGVSPPARVARGALRAERAGVGGGRRSPLSSPTRSRRGPPCGGSARRPCRRGTRPAGRRRSRPAA